MHVTEVAELLEMSRSSVYRHLAVEGSKVERASVIRWLRSQQRAEHERRQKQIERVRAA